MANPLLFKIYSVTNTLLYFLCKSLFKRAVAVKPWEKGGKRKGQVLFAGWDREGLVL